MKIYITKNRIKREIYSRYRIITKFEATLDNTST